MPSDGKLLNRDVVPRLVGQAAEGWLAWRVGDFSRPQLLDDFRGRVSGVVWEVEEYSSAVSRLLLGLGTKVVESCTLEIYLGVVHGLLEKRSELVRLVAPVQKAVKEELEFPNDVLLI